MSSKYSGVVTSVSPPPCEIFSQGAGNLKNNDTDKTSLKKKNTEKHKEICLLVYL